jgi:hypothetical protein
MDFASGNPASGEWSLAASEAQSGSFPHSETDHTHDGGGAWFFLLLIFFAFPILLPPIYYYTRTVPKDTEETTGLNAESGTTPTSSKLNHHTNWSSKIKLKWQIPQRSADAEYSASRV